jgi:hypothetical protein
VPNADGRKSLPAIRANVIAGSVQLPANGRCHLTGERLGAGPVEMNVFRQLGLREKRFDEPEEIIHRDATGFHDSFRRFVVMCRRANFVTISSIFLVYCFSVAYTGASALGRLDLAIRYSGKAKGKQGGA